MSENAASSAMLPNMILVSSRDMGDNVFGGDDVDEITEDAEEVMVLDEGRMFVCSVAGGSWNASCRPVQQHIQSDSIVGWEVMERT